MRPGVWSIVLAATTLSGPCFGDTIQLKNGDQLTGQVVEQTDSVVVVDYGGGQIRIDRALVDTVATDGQTQQEAEQSPTPPPAQAPAQEGATGNQGGENTDDNAAQADRIPAESGDTNAAAPQNEDEKERWFGDGFLPGWDKQIEAGFTGTEGNSQTLNVSASVEFKRKTDEQRTDLSSSYFRTQSDGEVTQNQFEAQAKQDWLVPGHRYFYFAQGKYEYDDFEPWLHRVSAFGGVGYDFYKQDRFTLTGRVGLGANYEFGDVNELTPEGLIGVEATYEINGTQSINFINTLYPSLNNAGEFRNITTFDWTLSLSRDGDKKKGFSLKFGIENEYESDVQPDANHNDLLYFGRLVYGF